MTLIIYAECLDAKILICDRQESILTKGERNSVKKYYLSENKDFVIALAGHGLRIDLTVGALHENPKISCKDIVSKLKKFLKQPSKILLGDVGGILLAKKNSSYEYFDVSTVDNLIRIVPNDPKFNCYGTDAGTTIAMYLMRQHDISATKWQESCEFLISVMDKVSENYDGIGNLEEGFDILVITNSGKVLECSQYNQNIHEKIKINFEPNEIAKIESMFNEVGVTPPVEEPPVEEPPVEEPPVEEPPVEEPPVFPNIINPQPPYDITRPTCTQCGRELGFIDIVTADGKCSTCSPPKPLFNITRPTCTQCGRELSFIDIVTADGKCSTCSQGSV